MGPTFYQLVEDAAANFGDREFMYDGTYRMSFAQLRNAGQTLARFLLENGIKPGDAAVVCVPNWAEYLQIYAGVSACGAILATCPADSKRSRLIEVIRLVNPKAVFAIEEEQLLALQEIGYKGLVISVRFPHRAHDGNPGPCRTDSPALDGAGKADLSAHQHALEAVIAYESIIDLQACSAPPADPIDPVRSMDVSTIIFTSGSTGAPKGVMSTAYAHQYVSQMIATSLDLQEDDVFYIPVPFCHIFGLCNGLLIPLMHGSRLVVTDWYSPTKAVGLIEQEGCTVQFGVPTMFIRQLRVSEEKGMPFTLRAGVIGGAVTPPGLIEEYELKTGGRVLASYGMTETTGGITLTRFDDPAYLRYGADGCAIPGAELAILDGNGNELPAGEIGEIAVRTPGIMGGYYEGGSFAIDPDLAENWFMTGDLGCLDEHGYLHITGRMKDIIKRGGTTIYPSEIECVFHAIPQVLDACLIGYGQGDLGERAYLFLTLAENGARKPTVDDLMQHAREHLERHKVPDRIEVIEKMPRLGTSKIDKRALAEILEAKLAQQSV